MWLAEHIVGFDFFSDLAFLNARFQLYSLQIRILLKITNIIDFLRTLRGYLHIFLSSKVLWHHKDGTHHNGQYYL